MEASRPDNNETGKEHHGPNKEGEELTAHVTQRKRNASRDRKPKSDKKHNQFFVR
jgi:hypothetical protein